MTIEKRKFDDHPTIGFIEGDGIGPDCSLNTIRLVDAAVEKSYAGSRKIEWREIYAGEKAKKVKGEWLPAETLDAIREMGIALKGPLTTPVGEGFRSLNVTLRQELDLYANIRPVRHFPGVPSPLCSPELLDVIIFRENTEDVYAGIEWEANSPEAADMRKFLKDRYDITLRDVTGIGIKPISLFATERLVRRAFDFTKKKKLPYFTIVHKGNIMKYTEGAFLNWALELLEKEYPGQYVLEGSEKCDEGKIIVRDRIADNMFQQVLLRPTEHDVIVTTNLNGDYLSDACVAQVGGLGLAPGANIGDEAAVFEAVHGTAPKYAGMDKANPTSMMLSSVMMLEHLEWDEAANSIIKAIVKTVGQKKLTYDLARFFEGATELKSSEYTDAVIENLP
jgi:isocitrate dehydrogenase